MLVTVYVGKYTMYIVTMGVYLRYEIKLHSRVKLPCVVGRHIYSKYERKSN